MSEKPIYLITYPRIGVGHVDAIYCNGVKLGELLQDVDGFYKFFPESRAGYWEEAVMRDIADALDALNSAWEFEIEHNL
jgi:hypothetical protein